jgi:hypothetical protein
MSVNSCPIAASLFHMLRYTPRQHAHCPHNDCPGQSLTLNCIRAAELTTNDICIVGSLVCCYDRTSEPAGGGRVIARNTGHCWRLVTVSSSWRPQILVTYFRQNISNVRIKRIATLCLGRPRWTNGYRNCHQNKRWRSRQYEPLKRRSTSTRLHGAIKEKGAIFDLFCLKTAYLSLM